MRILQICNHCKNSGNGIVNVAVDLACAQARGGHSVAFASARGDYSALLSGSGVTYFEVDMERRSLGAIANAARQLARIIGDFKPEIVHAHMMTGAILARVLKILFRFGLVTTVHNEFQRSAILMRVGDRVIAISNAVRDALIKRGLPRDRLRVVLNGPLGTPRLSPSDSVVAANVSRPAIVTVAGLSQRKGIADLIDAFQLIAVEHPNANLYIVGDGPQREEFEARAAESSAGYRITFVGFVADPRPYMLAADVFVLASHDEPFGLVLAEARAFGRAIVATNVGGVPEVLELGRAGVLTPPRSTEQLASAISGLLDTPQQREALQVRARENLGMFSVDRLNDETLKVYLELSQDAIL